MKMAISRFGGNLQIHITVEKWVWQLKAWNAFRQQLQFCKFCKHTYTDLHAQKKYLSEREANGCAGAREGGGEVCYYLRVVVVLDGFF